MSVSVTPLSVTPEALPGPHTALSVPKSPGPAAASVVLVAAAAAGCVVDDELELRPLHAAPTRANDTAAAIAAARERITFSPRLGTYAENLTERQVWAPKIKALARTLRLTSVIVKQFFCG
jgi:hypothetical protein